MDAELAVVGAGPAALAVLNRLAYEASGHIPGAPDAALSLLARTVIVDASGGWLALWRRKLGSQGVSHLRSPTFVHPHASRLIDDALLAFAASHGRLDETAPLDDAAPPGASAAAWRAPSAALFDDFCAAALAELCAAAPALCGERLVVAVRAGNVSNLAARRLARPTG